eukprot:556774-Pelagomonas_calceolata.AAC.1
MDKKYYWGSGGLLEAPGPKMDYMLTKKTLQVVRVNSGKHSNSKLLSMRHVIQGCQNLVSATRVTRITREKSLSQDV